MKKSEAAHQWPVMFGRRLGIIEQNLKKVEEFAPLKAEGLATIRIIREMAILRDMLIHGIPVRYDEEKGAVVYQRVDRLTEKQKRSAKSAGFSHFQNTMTLRFETLEEATNRCILINTRLSDMRDALGKM